LAQQAVQFEGNKQGEQQNEQVVLHAGGGILGV
jgi:hypothetical protein